MKNLPMFVVFLALLAAIPAQNAFAYGAISSGTGFSGRINNITGHDTLHEAEAASVADGFSAFRIRARFVNRCAFLSVGIFSAESPSGRNAIVGISDQGVNDVATAGPQMVADFLRRCLGRGHDAAACNLVLPDPAAEYTANSCDVTTCPIGESPQLPAGDAVLSPPYPASGSGADAACAPCTGNTVPDMVLKVGCVPCPAGRVANAGVCECPAGMEDNPDTTGDVNDCRCENNGFNNGGTCEPVKDCSTGNGDKMLLDAATNTCICPAGMEDNPDTTGDTNDCRCENNGFNNGGTCEPAMDCSTGNGDKTLLDAATNTCICPAGMEDNPDTAGDTNDCRCENNGFNNNGTCEVVMDCAGNGEKTARNEATNICGCESGFEDDATTEITNDCQAVCTAPNVHTGEGRDICAAPIDCGGNNAGGSVPNNTNDACVCPEDTQLYGGVNVCAASLPPGRYSAENCMAGDWTITVLADSENRIRQNCIIPVEIEAANFIPAASGGIAAAAALKPQQTNVGDMPDGCVLTQHEGFTAAGNNAPLCNAANLFGDFGLPERPAVFPAGARITVAAGGHVYFNSAVPLTRIAATDTVGSGANGGANIASGGGGVGPGGIMIFALIGAVLLSGGDGLNPDAFAFTPHTSFSHNGGANYSYGSRLDYRQNEVSAYWGASQTGTDGGADSWRYTSGLKYAKDFWSAAFDGVNYEKATEIDMRFSAEFRSGIWHWQSGINADYDLDELGAGDGAAYWNTEAAVFYNRWEISPSVGLYWRDGEDFGEDARFRINLRREF